MTRNADRMSAISKWVFGAIFLTAPLTTLRPVGSVTLGDLFLVFGFILALAVFLYKRRLPPLPCHVWIGSGVLVVAIALTVLWPPESVQALVKAFEPAPYSSSLSAGVRLLISLVALPVAVSLVVDRWSTVSFLVSAWIAGATLSCLVAVIDACLGSGLQRFFADDPGLLAVFQNGVPPRFMGLSVHPTSFSITAAMVVPLVLSRMSTARNAVMYSPVALVLMLGVVLSGSRVGILSAIAIVVIYLCASPNLRRVLLRGGFWPPALATLITAACALVFFLGPPVDPATQDTVGTVKLPSGASVQPGNGTGTGSGETFPAQRLPRDETGSAVRFDPEALGSDESTKERLQRYEDSLDFITDRPFLGYGFEWIEASHSIYLQLLVSGGVLALIGFLTTMWGYGVAWFRSRKEVPDELRETMIGLGVSIVGFLIMGAAQTDLLDRYLYLPVGLVVAAYAMVLTNRGSETA